jgi:flagellar motor switch protein FliM
MALARATRDSMALGLEVTMLTLTQASLTELLDTVPERSLIAVLEGPHDGLGIMVLSPAVLAALIEVQTLGRVTSAPPQSRKPTRTDAAMVAGWMEMALRGVEGLLEAEPDLTWIDGFRYASFLDEPRPLGLLLEDVPYRQVTVEVSLAMGMKKGVIVLALPAGGRGRKPRAGDEDVASQPPTVTFAQEMEARLMAVECSLHAVIARLQLPLSAVLALTPGALLPLGEAGIDRIYLETAQGRPLAEGRLGQHRGHRALRLTAIPEDREGQILQGIVTPASEAAPSFAGTSRPELRAG